MIRVTADKFMVWLTLLAFIFPAALVFMHSEQTSPIDEWVFIDYTSKVFDQGYVHEGERVGAFTANLMACEGVIPGTKYGVCGADPIDYKALPYTGLTAAAAYTPAYFWATRFLGLPFQLLGADQLTAWRLTGALWLAAGIAAFILLLRSWGISNRKILPLALVVIASPYIWWAHTFVSTDAPSVFVGAGLLLLATKIYRNQLAVWWLIPAFVSSVALKVTNLVSVGLVVVFLLANFISKKFAAKKDLGQANVLATAHWRVASVAVVAGLLAVSVPVMWGKFITATAVSADRVDQGISFQLNLKELALQVVNFLPSTLVYSPFSGHGVDFAWVPLSWITIAGVIGAFFLFKKSNTKFIMVLSILISSIVMAPLLAIAVQLSQGAYFQLSPRYGASLVPGFMLCVAFILRNRLAQFSLIFYAAGLFAIGMYGGLLLS